MQGGGSAGRPLPERCGSAAMAGEVLGRTAALALGEARGRAGAAAP